MGHKGWHCCGCFDCSDNCPGVLVSKWMICFHHFCYFLGSFLQKLSTYLLEPLRLNIQRHNAAINNVWNAWLPYHSHGCSSTSKLSLHCCQAFHFDLQDQPQPAVLPLNESEGLALQHYHHCFEGVWLVFLQWNWISQQSTKMRDQFHCRCRCWQLRRVVSKQKKMKYFGWSLPA